MGQTDDGGVPLIIKTGSLLTRQVLIPSHAHHVGGFALSSGLGMRLQDILSELGVGGRAFWQSILALRLRLQQIDELGEQFFGIVGSGRRYGNRRCHQRL